jgi:hypothetical protein
VLRMNPGLLVHDLLSTATEYDQVPAGGFETTTAFEHLRGPGTVYTHRVLPRPGKQFRHAHLSSLSPLLARLLAGPGPLAPEFEQAIRRAEAAMSNSTPEGKQVPTNLEPIAMAMAREEDAQLRRYFPMPLWNEITRQDLNEALNDTDAVRRQNHRAVVECAQASSEVEDLTREMRRLELRNTPFDCYHVYEQYGAWAEREFGAAAAKQLRGSIHYPFVRDAEWAAERASAPDVVYPESLNAANRRQMPSSKYRELWSEEHGAAAKATNEQTRKTLHAQRRARDKELLEELQRLPLVGREPRQAPGAVPGASTTTHATGLAFRGGSDDSNSSAT